MLDLIQTHILDILAADARLIAGGNAYEAGWAGVKRVDNGTDAPSAGCINLFDEVYEPDSGTARPAIYVGTRGMEASDKLDFVSIAGQGRIEYRVLLLPLLLAVQAPTKFAAKKQRNQLRANVLHILFDHLIESGYWYELTVPGESGGGSAKAHVWTTATGGGAQSVAEAMASLPLVIRYSWNGTSPP